MKKLFALLLVSVCLIIGGALNVYAAETTNLLSEDYLNTPSGGTWEWVDGKLVATNKELGDTAMMTDIFVDVGEHVVIEATGNISDGNAWGIMMAEVDPAAPFASWICLNMDLTRPSTRLFGPNVNIPDEAQLFSNDFTTGQDHTLALEITEDGLFRVYFNGELYGERQNDNWIGGYVGLMSFFSNVSFSKVNFIRLDGEEYKPEKIELVVEAKAYDVRELELGETTDLLAEENFKFSQNGEFKWENGKLIAPNAAMGDCATMTDYFVDVDDHVYIEVTGNVTEGQAFGIMMPRISYETPFDSWMCMNMEIGRPSTRLFGPGFAKEVQLFSNDFTNNKPLTIGLEIDNGTFYLYSEGELYGFIENTEWQGCYIGLMTWTGSVEFTSFKVSEVTAAKQYTVNPDGSTTADAPAAEEVVETPAVEEEVVETPAVEEVETPAPEAPVVEDVVEVPAAPQTFDIFTACFAAAAISGLALVFGKKRN
ncbi:MAG: hypothetical protein IJC71_00400 [Clostridia bacterium]|nr:hypothetical protein [Clostridia bacterium]